MQPTGTTRVSAFSGINLSDKHTIAPIPLFVEFIKEKFEAILNVGVPVCLISIG